MNLGVLLIAFVEGEGGRKKSQELVRKPQLLKRGGPKRTPTRTPLFGCRVTHWASSVCSRMVHRDSSVWRPSGSPRLPCLAAEWFTETPLFGGRVVHRDSSIWRLGGSPRLLCLATEWFIETPLFGGRMVNRDSPVWRPSDSPGFVCLAAEWFTETPLFGGRGGSRSQTSRSIVYDCPKLIPETRFTRTKLRCTRIAVLTP